MVQLTVEQRTFLVKNFFKTESLKVTRKRFSNGAKRRSGRKPGVRVTNFVLAEFKVVAHGTPRSNVTRMRETSEKRGKNKGKLNTKD